jgi:hypothetical protein
MRGVDYGRDYHVAKGEDDLPGNAVSGEGVVDDQSKGHGQHVAKEAWKQPAHDPRLLPT